MTPELCFSVCCNILLFALFMESQWVIKGYRKNLLAMFEVNDKWANVMTDLVNKIANSLKELEESLELYGLSFLFRESTSYKVE